MASIIKGQEALTPYRWEMFLRGVILSVHRTVEATALDSMKARAPVLSGELRRSIEVEPAAVEESEMRSAVVTTKREAHFSWVRTTPRIYPRTSPVLVFPITPEWAAKPPPRLKKLSEKEIRESKVITSSVTGRKYRPWREEAVEETAKRLRPALSRLKLRPVLGL